MGTVDLIDFEILCDEQGQEKYADMPADLMTKYAGQVAKGGLRMSGR